MKIATKFGVIVTMMASLTLMTACGSKKKAEDNAELALIEQTQELMADTGIEEETDNYASDSVSNEYSESYSDTTNNDYSESFNDSTTEEANLGASSSGLGH